MDGCKHTQLAPRQRLPWSKLNHSSHASRADQTNNGKNRQKPHAAHIHVPDEEKEKKIQSRLLLPYHKPHTIFTTITTTTTMATNTAPNLLTIDEATSIVTRAPATPTPCCSLNSLRDRKQSTGDTCIKPKVLVAEARSPIDLNQQHRSARVVLRWLLRLFN